MTNTDIDFDFVVCQHECLSDVGSRQMGARGRKLVDEKYTWDAVVKAMLKGYEDMQHGR